MTTTDIEARIRARGYQTPGRARAAIKMVKAKGKVRALLEELVNEWENEGTPEVVVAGVPSAEAESEPRRRTNGRRHPQMSGSISDAPAPVEGSVQNGKLAPVRALPAPSALAEPLRVNLNARVRVRLTPFGVTRLYAARHKVAVPDDLMEKKGVWETVLWQFMLVMGENLSTDDAAVTEGSDIELLSTRP